MHPFGGFLPSCRFELEPFDPFDPFSLTRIAHTRRLNSLVGMRVTNKNGTLTEIHARQLVDSAALESAAGASGRGETADDGITLVPSDWNVPVRGNAAPPTLRTSAGARTLNLCVSVFNSLDKLRDIR
jgi:hypothetical protein